MGGACSIAGTVVIARQEKLQEGIVEYIGN
jgi:hypothetical protein